MFPKVFLTVGTTKFDELINLFDNDDKIIEVLKKIGCKILTVQYGNGAEPKLNKCKEMGITVATYGLKPTILDDINDADLVISHAGAGTCIEVLGAGKPLIVVVNDQLMDNHQTELAEQLSEEGYLSWSTTQTLVNVLGSFKKMKSYDKGDVSAFISALDGLMGF